MSLISPPQFAEGFAPHFAAMQMAANASELFELSPLAAIECKKSLDDLDEESDEDKDEEADPDEEFDEDEDEDDDEDLDEDFDEDEDDEDEDEDEDEEDDEDTVKPLKM